MNRFQFGPVRHQRWHATGDGNGRDGSPPLFEQRHTARQTRTRESVAPVRMIQPLVRQYGHRQRWTMGASRHRSRSASPCSRTRLINGLASGLLAGTPGPLHQPMPGARLVRTDGKILTCLERRTWWPGFPDRTKVIFDHAFLHDIVIDRSPSDGSVQVALFATAATARQVNRYVRSVCLSFRAEPRATDAASWYMRHAALGRGCGLVR